MRASFFGPLRSFGAASLSVILVLSGSPASAIAATQSSAKTAMQTVSTTGANASEAEAQSTTSTDSSWSDDIDEMLAAGSYVDGQVIVTALDEKVSDEPAPEWAIEIETETLYTTTGDRYEEAMGTAIPEEALEAADDRLNVDDDIVTSSEVRITQQLVTVANDDNGKPLMSTEDMLKALSFVPVILSASPNYTYDEADDGDSAYNESGTEAADESEDTTSAKQDANAESDEQTASLAETTSSDQAATVVEGEETSLTASASKRTSSFEPENEPTDVTTTSDATGYQWAYGNSTAYGMSLYNKLSSVADATWNTSVQNSAGVIAVVDSGIDYTHPELSSAMVDMTPYLAKTGGGQYGINALQINAHNDTVKDAKDKYGHGTHVAGIIAAATNGYGVSGISRGAKLLSVKVTENGDIETSTVIEAYSYLKKVANAGVDLRVVNNSWTPRNFTLSNQLYLSVLDLATSYGVASAFASGNKGIDLDRQYGKTDDDANTGMTYVNSIDMTGKRSVFSSYGATRTNICAPGGSIISTVPISADVKYGRYVASAMGGIAYPGSSDGTGYESFAGNKALVATTRDGATLTTSIDKTKSFDSQGGSMVIKGDQLAKTYVNEDKYEATSRIVLNVPVNESQLDQVSMIGCTAYFTGSSGHAWLDIKTNGNNGGWGSGNYGKERSSITNGNWTTLSCNLYKACGASGDSILVFHDASGQAYIQIAICTNKSLKKNPYSATNELRIDTVGLGNKYWSYDIMSGTSMATPVVSGFLANISYSLDQQGKSYSSLEKCIRAQKITGVLWRSTTAAAGNTLPDLKGKCSTGGSVSAKQLATAIAQDKNAVYVGKLDVTTINKKYARYKIRGSGFSASSKVADASLNDDDMDISDIDVSDDGDYIEFTAERVNGNGTVSVTVKDTDSDSEGTAELTILDTCTSTDDGNNEQDDKGSNDKGDNTTGGKDKTGSGAQGKKRSTSKGNLAQTGDPTILMTGIAAMAGAGILVTGVQLKRRRR